MPKDTSENTLFHKLAELYSDMETAYDRAAAEIFLTCKECSDNCCNSYFQHHTHIEWAYLWVGMRSCSHDKQQEVIDRAEQYVRQSQALLAQGNKPGIMCPLNDDGLCQLYKHRLMICRMHGVPNRLVMPGGNKKSFPGCFRCQELCSHLKEVPVMDRTPLYRKLASLEMAFVGPGTRALPRVNLTLAEMLVKGPQKT